MWLMISEIYPLNIRGATMSAALSFPVLLATLGGAGSLWVFAELGIVAGFFVYFDVVGSKCCTLEEIEADLRGTAVASSRVR